MSVNTGEWLTAVDRHPETLDTDLLVAIALVDDQTAVEGVKPETAQDSVEELIALGFLEVVLDIDGEQILELRFP